MENMTGAITEIDNKTKIEELQRALNEAVEYINTLKHQQQEKIKNLEDQIQLNQSIIIAKDNEIKKQSEINKTQEEHIKQLLALTKQIQLDKNAVKLKFVKFQTQNIMSSSLQGNNMSNLRDNVQESNGYYRNNGNNGNNGNYNFNQPKKQTLNDWRKKPATVTSSQLHDIIDAEIKEAFTPMAAPMKKNFYQQKNRFNPF